VVALEKLSFSMKITVAKMMVIINCNNEFLNEIRGEFPSARLLKKWLVQGADVNCKVEGDEYTPLMLAVEAQKYRIAEYLLRQGANPLLRNNINKISSDLVSSSSLIYPILKDYELLFASMNNDLETVKSVLNNGALVNFRGCGGYTALMIAVEGGFMEMVDFLLSQGADMSLTCTDGRGIFELTTNIPVLSILERMHKLRIGLPRVIEIGDHRFFSPLAEDTV
jgi:ankyrin repeat protein